MQLASSTKVNHATGVNTLLSAFTVNMHSESQPYHFLSSQHNYSELISQLVHSLDLGSMMG